jgi:hypothetical protein
MSVVRRMDIVSAVAGPQRVAVSPCTGKAVIRVRSLPAPDGCANRMTVRESALTVAAWPSPPFAHTAGNPRAADNAGGPRRRTSGRAVVLSLVLVLAAGAMQWSQQRVPSSTPATAAATSATHRAAALSRAAVGLARSRLSAGGRSGAAAAAGVGGHERDPQAPAARTPGPRALGIGQGSVDARSRAGSPVERAPLVLPARCPSTARRRRPAARSRRRVARRRGGGRRVPGWWRRAGSGRSDFRARGAAAARRRASR